MEERVLCAICNKEGKPSEVFPDWCERCEELYGDLYDIEERKPLQNRRRHWNVPTD